MEAQASSLLLLLLCGGSSLIIIMILCRLLEAPASALLLPFWRLEPPHFYNPFGGLSLFIIVILVETKGKRIIIIMKMLEPLHLLSLLEISTESKETL